MQLTKTTLPASLNQGCSLLRQSACFIKKRSKKQLWQSEFFGEKKKALLIAYVCVAYTTYVCWRRRTRDTGGTTTSPMRFLAFVVKKKRRRRPLDWHRGAYRGVPIKELPSSIILCARGVRACLGCDGITSRAQRETRAPHPRPCRAPFLSWSAEGRRRCGAPTSWRGHVQGAKGLGGSPLSTCRPA
jgi:hypothetical protein